ncbi:SDR family oxidoreductase [Albimonas pacifica]|uniref:NAD(P)-dependent dehydrogenase, short-chain alcohol dehydrogenase family n=1 Tax=Albimonas pacifica TaxID=1114924 RepID=A0A1I3BT33_9RHOB|nr:SDR family oxidoreductase [Albimonas pacifica]SFH65089.1 NAD(P)-dependent dehydrogenase, short-chain alcohol dehydrogenase family [Albimonas pacifica]
MSYLDDLFGVRGKTALVTGGATGIGRMIAEALAQGGARVLIASRKGADCEAAAAEINALIKEAGGVGSVEGFSGDVGSEGGCETLAQEVAKRTDALHILFNNAGVAWAAKDFDTFPYAAWDKVFRVNVAGAYELTRQLLPLLEKAATDADPARVISLGSVMGHWPIGDGSYSYSASKAAVHQMTKILAKECASRRITFNAFAPGPFPSRMTAFATGTEEKQEAVGQDIPLGRVGRAQDMAGAALYLCSRAGAYVTGCILPLDGGIGVMTGGDLWEKGRD